MHTATDIFGILCVALADAAYSTPEPTVTSAESWLQLVERFGIMACILLYFLYRDYMKSREDLKQRLHDQAWRERTESYVRDTLVNELQQTRSAITKSTTLMKRVVESVSICPGFRQQSTDGDSDLHPTPALDGESNVQEQSPSSDGSTLSS